MHWISPFRFHEFKLELSKLEKPVVVIGSSIAIATSAAPKPPASKRDRGFLQFVLMESRLIGGPSAAARGAHASARTPLGRLLPNKYVGYHIHSIAALVACTWHQPIVEARV